MPDGATVVGMKIIHHELGDFFPFSRKNVEGTFNFVTKVSNDLIVGATMSSGSSVVKSAFARFDLGKGFIANLKMEGTAAIKGDFGWQEEQFRGHGSNSVLGLSFDSSSPQGVDRVSYACTSAGWFINPTMSWKTRQIDLVASAQCSEDTRITVAAKGDGSSAIEVEHQLADDTLITLKSDGVATAKGLVLELHHHLDRKNTVQPGFDVGTRTFSLAWVHRLDAPRAFSRDGASARASSSSAARASYPPPLGPAQQPGRRGGLEASGGRQPPNTSPLLLEGEGRTLTVKVLPRKYVAVDLEGSRDGDWVLSLWAPWGDFSDSNLSIGRKMLM
jgi:hypothetical protein